MSVIRLLSCMFCPNSGASKGTKYLVDLGLLPWIPAWNKCSTSCSEINLQMTLTELRIYFDRNPKHWSVFMWVAVIDRTWCAYIFVPSVLACRVSVERGSGGPRYSLMGKAAMVRKCEYFGLLQDSDSHLCLIIGICISFCSRKICRRFLTHPFLLG